MQPVTVGRDLIGRLVDKFHLRGGPAPAIQVNPTLYLVTVVDRLPEYKVLLLPQVAIGATGYYVLATVPVGKRWTVKMFRAGLSTGTWTFTEARVGDTEAASGSTFLLKSQTAATVMNYGPAADFALGPGWKLWIYVDSYAVAGKADCRVLVEEEDV